MEIRKLFLCLNEGLPCPSPLLYGDTSRTLYRALQAQAPYVVKKHLLHMKLKDEDYWRRNIEIISNPIFIQLLKIMGNISTHFS